MALSDNLVAYRKLDETSGTNANDEIGTKDATLSGCSFTSSGKINYGASASGTNPGIVLADGTTGTIGTGDFAISFWIYPVTTAASHYPMLFGAFENAAGYKGPTIFFDPNGVNSTGDGIDFRVIGTNQNKVTSPSASSLYNKRTHIVFTRVSGVCYVYYDGVEKTHFNDTTNIPAASAGCSFMFGRNGDGFQHQDSGAKFDECGFWNRGLSSTEVSTLYNSGSGNQYPFTEPSTFIPKVIQF